MFEDSFHLVHLNVLFLPNPVKYCFFFKPILPEPFLAF